MSKWSNILIIHAIKIKQEVNFLSVNYNQVQERVFCFHSVWLRLIILHHRAYRQSVLHDILSDSISFGCRMKWKVDWVKYQFEVIWLSQSCQVLRFSGHTILAKVLEFNLVIKFHLKTNWKDRRTSIIARDSRFVSDSHFALGLPPREKDQKMAYTFQKVLLSWLYYLCKGRYIDLPLSSHFIGHK